MKPRANGVSRAQRSASFQGEGPNWVLIVGGALLSTLSIRLGYKLKQAADTKQLDNAANGNGKFTDRRKLGANRLRSNIYSFTQDEDGCFNYNSGSTGSHGDVDRVKHHENGHIISETELALPLVTASAPEFNRENGVIWSTSPDRLEQPRKPFHRSNCSDSPCVSDSGSDIFTKREVIQKLRHQLKRRDDMILDMQDQILDLQNSLSAQHSHTTHIQSQLDATNRDLFDSEREIQRLRKAIADHCVGQVNPNESVNGHVNGFLDRGNDLVSLENGKLEMLRREVGELKDVIEGKEYLLQNYKEQKTELSSKVKELQQRLDSQLPNIL